MPSNYTPNYQLNQWEGSDAVLRIDFNADNAKIDAALKAVDQRVDGKADVSALSGLSSQISSLSSTVSGHTSSLSSHSGSIAKLGNCQIYFAKYNGENAASKTISFPGYPVFVYVRNISERHYLVLLRDSNPAEGSYNTQVSITATWASRSVTWTAPSADAALNYRDTSYAVMALLDMSK